MNRVCLHVLQALKQLVCGVLKHLAVGVEMRLDLILLAADGKHGDDALVGIEQRYGDLGAAVDELVGAGRPAPGADCGPASARGASSRPVG